MKPETASLSVSWFPLQTSESDGGRIYAPLALAWGRNLGQEPGAGVRQCGFSTFLLGVVK